MNYTELRDKIMGRAAELIAQGSSGDQLAYLMKALNLLENVKTQNDVVDALAQVASFRAELDALKSQETLTRLGKPAVRLFKEVANNVDNNWRFKVDPGWTNGRLKDSATQYTPENLPAVKTLAQNLGMELQIGVKDKFVFERDYHCYNNNWNEYHFAVSVILLKNNSDLDKEITVTVDSSSDNNWNITHTCLVANGTVIFEWTDNNQRNNQDFNITIPASQKLVLVMSSGAYRWDTWYGAWYALRQNITITKPEDVDYDYEAYREILS